MLLAHLDDVAPVGADGECPPLGDLVAFYKAAKARFDGDAAFAARARDNVATLRRGDVTSTSLQRRRGTTARSGPRERLPFVGP